MTALGELLRTELHRYDPLALRGIAEPYGPDERVFGPPRNAAPDHVKWPGCVLPCQCREAGIAPLKNY